MSYPTYPSYKESGIEWLGEVPEHWDVKRLKFLSNIQTGDKDTVDAIEDGKYPFFVRSQIVERINSFTFNCEAVLTAGDGAGVGKVFHHYKGPFDFHQRVYMLNKFRCVAGRFLFYFLKENFYKVALEGGAKSTVDSLRMPLFQNFSVAIPPVQEQMLIVNFIDYETAKIDSLIAKQQQLIETIQEKRKALTLHIVTKGLNPHAPLKDSGIEWIGTVPAHWQIMRNKVVFREVDERSISGDEELLTVSHITGVTPRSEKNVNMFLAESLVGYKKCKRSDLIINTMWAWMGALGLSQYEGVISPSYNVYRLRSKSMVNPKYLDFLYRTPAHIVEINRYSKGVWESRMRLYPDAFFTMQIALPPREEQDAIVDYLGKQLKLMDALEEKCQKAIELLQERRTSLISAAVTGKIDVRAYGNHEP